MKNKTVKINKIAETKTACAIKVLESAMKRNELNLLDMHRAVNIMTDSAIEKTIMRMRSEGCSIRKIARAIHMDDTRVSKIIKDNVCCCSSCKDTKTCAKKGR